MDSFIDIANGYMSALSKYGITHIVDNRRSDYKSVCYGCEDTYFIMGLDESADRHLVELIIKSRGVNITEALCAKYSIANNDLFFYLSNDEVDKACSRLVVILEQILTKMTQDISLDFDQIRLAAKRTSEKTVITEDLKKADQAWINGDHTRALDIYAQWDGILSPLQKKRLDSIKSKGIEND